MTERPWLAWVGPPVLVLAVVAAHLAPGLDGSFVASGLRDGLHVLGFAVVAVLIFELLPMGPLGRAAAAFLLAMLLGVASEGLQQYAGRLFNPADLYRDAAGAGIGLLARVAWAVTQQAGNTRNLRVFGRATAALAVVLLLAPLLYWWGVLMDYRHRMPVLADFDDPKDAGLVTPIQSAVEYLPTYVSEDGLLSGVAKVTLLKRAWSGILMDTVISDWSGYETLVVRVAMDGAPDTRINVELADGAHPGVRTQHLIGSKAVGPVMQEARFDLREIVSVAGRPALDRASITHVYLIGKHKGDAAALYLDEVWLE